MPESTQHKLDRVRRPRVQITYDVETLGSIVKTELPFVVGIMADLSGNAIPKLHNQPANTNLTPLKDRKFVEIDRDNFNVIMEKLEPTVKLATGDELAFKSLDDFDPIKVLGQVKSLKDMFDSRTRLSNLVAKLDGNVALQKEFIDAYNSLADKTALKTYYNTVKAPPQAPGTIRITPAVTTGVTQTAGLVITLATEDATRVGFFKITDIKGGKLFKTDGTTLIKDGDSIAPADGTAGLKFTPGEETTSGSFTVTALDANHKVLTDISPEKAKITVKAPGTISITPAATTNVKQTTDGLVITLAGEDAHKVKSFKITAIKGGALFKTDGTTPISNNDPIDVATGKAGLKFTPAANSPGGSFIVSALDKDNGAVSSFAPQTAQITVKKGE